MAGEGRCAMPRRARGLGLPDAQASGAAARARTRPVPDPSGHSTGKRSQDVPPSVDR